MPKISNHRPARKARRAKQSSCIYRVHNWSAYDRALKQRGSVTLWFAPEAVAAWNYEGAAQRGAQFVYSDLAIETALRLRLIYHLPLRQTEGFVESLLHLMGLDLSAPDHSTLSRRQKGLPVDLPTRLPQEPIHLVVDSSGLKSMAKVSGRCGNTAGRCGAPGASCTWGSTRPPARSSPRP